MLNLYLANISNLDAEQDMSLFSEYRIHKTAKIKSAQKRKQSIAAEMLLIHAVTQAMPNVCLPFSIKCGEKGKPEFADLPFFFNLSHSGDFVACAISDKTIGLDIEFDIKNNEKISERFFQQHEKEMLDRAADKKRMFAKIWTAKESALKFLGSGLSGGLFSVGVYNDCVLLEPKGQRIELRWYETERLCMALCAESIPKNIHIEKLELV